MDDKVIGALIAAASALLALLVRWGIETLQHRAKHQQDVDYLAVRVVCELERFMAGCDVVIHDTGRDLNTGAWIGEEKAPLLTFDDLKVEWKVIAPSLVYRVLNLPGDQAAADRWVMSLLEDDWEGTETPASIRRREYIKLGAKAAQLASELRDLAPVPQPHTDWAAKFAELHARLETREVAHSLS